MKGIKATTFVLVMLLSLGIPTVFSKNDNFGVDYVFEPVMDGGQWMIKDTMVLEEPGMPLVPYKVAEILLPQGAALKDVKVKHGNPVVQKGFEIPWGQPPCTFSDKPVKVGKNEAVYNSNNWYLGKTFDIVSVESFKGFNILLVHLYPEDYQLKSGTVKFYPKLTVEVQFGKGVKNKLYRGLAADKAAVADIVDNLDVLGTYEGGAAPLVTEEYIIITNDTLQSTFQTLTTHKAGYVNGATVYTTTWIYANYTGTDNQMKIRNFIIDKYNNNGLKYVLLGGDTGVVPYRGFFIYTGGYYDYDMAADMYFAHLDGTHNADGDSNYGETNDGVDFYADVAVGRAPVDNTTEAAAFVNKVIAYEGMTKPTRVCFHQSRVQPGNSPDARCLAYNCDDYIPGGYTIDYLFEENGNVSKTDWRNAWSAGPIVVTHIGHGNTDVYYINYEVGGTVSWYGSDCSSLTNTFYPWTTSVACICGEFEANDCLAEKYVKDDCGAIGAIYNDNYGWFSTANACMYSGEFCEMEVRACWDDGYEKLGDLLNRSRYYMASSAQSNSYYRWCFYERNLMGDPETPCLTKRGSTPPDTVTITNPSNGETVSGSVSITTSTTGAIDEVRFYIDNSLKYTDTSSPYSWSWDTTTYSEGSHTIRVDGYASGTFKDDDTVTVTVDNIVEPYVTITNPSQGQTVSSTVTCAASSNCDSVRWYIDGTYRAEDTSAPFQYSWDTTAESNGNHTVKAEGYNSGVYQCQDSVTVTVDNPPSSSKVTITSPINGSEVYGTVDITVSTEGCIDTVEFYIDDVLIGTDGIPPFGCPWDTTTYSEDQQHTICAKGYFNGQFKDSDYKTVTVNNDHIEITNPQDGDDVSGTVAITADARNIDIVQFYIDSFCICTDCEAPFECIWNTEGYEEDAPYVITAKGFTNDQIPNCTELPGYSEQPENYPIEPKAQDEITVTVNNIYVKITNPPHDGETVSCTVTIDVEARGIDTVEFYFDDVLIYTDTNLPFQYEWDTCLFSDGYYTLTVKGYASGEFNDSDTAVYEVYHYYVRITDPQQDELVSDTTMITIDANCVDTVELYIDDELKHTESIDPPHEGKTFQYEWDTCPCSNGTYTVTVKGYESGELKAFYEITVQVDNKYIVIIDPCQGETVSCTVPISTDSDCIGLVTAVIFYIDGNWLCTDTIYPFVCTWDTCLYSNGSHTITAEAYGVGSLTGSGEILDVPIDSDEITVEVDNGCIEIDYPSDGEDVCGAFYITTNASCCVDTVKFYIYKVGEPPGDPETYFVPPFKHYWNTENCEEDQQYTILVEAFYEGALKCTDEVTVTVNNTYVKITNPQDGDEVSCTVPITADAGNIDIVQFYIDEFCICTDCEAPFECSWNTEGYEEDASYVITAKGFTNDQIPNCTELVIYPEQPENYPIEPKAQDEITVTVNNIYVKITNPHDEQTVSCMVAITADTGCVDNIVKVEFYIDGSLMHTATTLPFSWDWDTTQYNDGNHTILVKGYDSGDSLVDEDSINITVDNTEVCLGTVLLGMLILFGLTVALRRR